MNLNVRISLPKALLIIGAFCLLTVLLSFVAYDNLYKTDKRNTYELKIDQLQAVLKREPDNVDAQLEIAMAMYLNGQEKKALKYYQEVLKQNPQNIKGLFYTGLIYSDLNRYQEAVENLEQVVKLQPGFQQGLLYYNMGVAKLKTGDYLGAVGNLQTALRLESGSPMAYYNLGLAYYNLKDYDQARHNLQKAAEFGYESKNISELLDKMKNL